MSCCTCPEALERVLRPRLAWCALSSHSITISLTHAAALLIATPITCSHALEPHGCMSKLIPPGPCNLCLHTPSLPIQNTPTNGRSLSLSRTRTAQRTTNFHTSSSQARHKFRASHSPAFYPSPSVRRSACRPPLVTTRRPRRRPPPLPQDCQQTCHLQHAHAHV